MPDKKVAVHFGAGNIGRGFIAPLLSKSGFYVVFVDVQDEIIDALNSEERYKVHILDAEETTTETVDDFTGLKPTVPDTIHAIEIAEVITTAVGAATLDRIAPTIARGITKRRVNGKGVLNVIACENMVGATAQLKDKIIDNIKKGDTAKEDLDYVNRKVGFANCEVDRIVPLFKGKQPLSVGVEGFKEWIVEKNSVKDGLEVEGMTLADDLEPFFDRKLYTLNCGHAILSYLGFVKGYGSVKEAMDDEEIRKITRGALEESGAALIKKHHFDEAQHKSYIDQTMERFENPNIDDELVRVSRNPLRKLSPNERLVGAVEMCKGYGLGHDSLLKGIAAAFHFDTQEDEEAVKLTQIVKEKGIEDAITETTKFERGSFEHKRVLEEYEALKGWKKRN